MILPFVTFEQAMLLERVGFDWKVPSYYITSNNEARGMLFTKEKADLKSYKGWRGWKHWQPTQDIRISAPTVSLALMWIRDVKNIRCGVSVNYYDDTIYSYSSLEEYCIAFEVGDGRVEAIGGFRTYKLAESALLDEILKLLV